MIQRILFIGNYPNPIEPHFNIFFQRLIFEIADLGIKCSVVAPVSITRYSFKCHKIPTHRVDYTKRGSIVDVYHPRYISYSSKTFFSLDTHVFTVSSFRNAVYREVLKRDLHFDATYGHFINIGGIPACELAQKHHVPSFIANGESNLKPSTYNYNSKYNLSALKNCSGIISVSQKNKKELEDLNLVEKGIIKVIPNAVDTDIFCPQDKKTCRKSLSLPEDEFIIGFVGSFSHRKGDQRILEAINGFNDVKAIFAGNGTKIPLSEQVLFCEDMDHDSIPAFLNCCDVFVLPTLNEGCSNAIVEAASCGLPIISSDLPFNDELLDSTNSIRVDPLSIDQIRDAILLLKNNEVLRRTLSQGSLNKINKFTIRERATKVIAFMNQTAERYYS